MIENPPGKMKQLLEDFRTKKITFEELQKECAYWYLDCFGEIRVRPLPTPPVRYQDYLKMDEAEKKEVPSSFWKLPDIKSYLDQKEDIESENKSTLWWLKEQLSHIPPEDFLGRTKFEEKIREFEHKDFY